MLRFLSVSLTLIAAGFGLSSCGGTAASGNDAATAVGASGASAATSEINPCSLMTGAEMAAITTDEVNTVKQWGDKQSCKYSSDPNDDGVSIVVWAHDGVHQMQVMRNATGLVGNMGKAVADKGAAGADTASALRSDAAATPKLGDESTWGPNTTLAVRKGDAYIEVSPPLMHDPASHSGYPLVTVEEKRKIAVTVAEKLLAKLGV